MITLTIETVPVIIKATITTTSIFDAAEVDQSMNFIIIILKHANR